MTFDECQADLSKAYEHLQILESRKPIDWSMRPEHYYQYHTWILSYWTLKQCIMQLEAKYCELIPKNREK